MKTPLVSIIVPVYNVESYVESCMFSLLNQDYTHLEIIAVNDGSTDQSFNVLQSLSVRDSRLKVINKKNEGVSATRNYALQLVKGDYVLFVDADDWIDLHTISHCMQKIQQYNADVCLFTYMREFKGQSNVKPLFDSDKVFDKEACKQLQRRMIGPIGPELRNPELLDSYGTIWAKLYRREVIKDIRFVDLSVIGTAEDTLFNCNAFLNIHKAVYLNQPYYHYRKFNGGSETKKYKLNLYLQWNILFEYIGRTVISEDGFQALNNRIVLSVIGLGLNECASNTRLFLQVKKIRIILNQAHYIRALQNFDFSFLRPHWRLFFLLLKYKSYFLLMFLVNFIFKILNRK